MALCLDVVAGPDVGANAGWRLAMPPPRHARLSDYRVAVLGALPWVPVDPEIEAALHDTTERLRSSGVAVSTTDLEELGDLREYFWLFRSMMHVLTSSGWPADVRREAIMKKRARQDALCSADARGLAATASDVMQWHGRRERYRQGWRAFFERYDVLLTPMTLVPAFPHPTAPVSERVLRIDGRACGFDYLSFYPAVATLAGQPATAFPAGLNRSGLPLGLQAIGPFLEDRTPLRFAQLMEEAFGGFRPPPGYAADF